jgi:tetratricopeptide (TPR) repeat protein
MTVLFLVALGFLAVLAYGSTALGVGTHLVIERLARKASMLSHAQGRDADALSELTQASDLEASMEKSPVTPGAIVPARELLGDLLWELNRPAQALKAYEQTLATDPNRLRSVYGAAKAAASAGDVAAAKTYYQQLVLLD